MVLNANFNNISVTAWRSDLFVEETGVTGENHRADARHWQTLSHNVESSNLNMSGIRTHNFSGDGRALIAYVAENSTPIRSRNTTAPLMKWLYDNNEIHVQM